LTKQSNRIRFVLKDSSAAAEASKQAAKELCNAIQTSFPETFFLVNFLVMLKAEKFIDCCTLFLLTDPHLLAT